MELNPVSETLPQLLDEVRDDLLLIREIAGEVHTVSGKMCHIRELSEHALELLGKS